MFQCHIMLQRYNSPVLLLHSGEALECLVLNKLNSRMISLLCRNFPRHTALFYTRRSDSSQEKTVITAANRHAWIARSSRTMTTLNIFVCLSINCSERFSPRVLSMRLACLSGGRSATFLRSGEIPARIFFSNKKKTGLPYRKPAVNYGDE